MFYGRVLYCLSLSLLLRVFESLETGKESSDVYTNTWAVQLDSHDEDLAAEIASSLGFVNRGAIASLSGYFEFVRDTTPKQAKRSAEYHTGPLTDHPRVIWAKQQTLLQRYKRGYSLFTEHRLLSRAEQNKRYFNDPEWSKQWYLFDDGQSSRRNLGVLDAVQLGYTGKNVVVSIIDDGLDHRHPDLLNNYDKRASTDVNDNDNDPLPDDSNPDNAHGTKCAGEVAAQADNNICGVGVAHEANIGGIRMLDGQITDTTEAKALGFEPNYIDIKSASWGPSDDGKTFGGPYTLAKEALRTGAEKGRGGKGTIFVWATGNGGRYQDNCNCDGYTSSIYTLSIGSVSPAGKTTYYDELCTSTMGVVYTGDSGTDSYAAQDFGNLITTALHNECTEFFSGTSCAAPLAAGIFALVLEANPNLTWRDMQHLVVETAAQNDPSSPSWNTNAAGKKYSRAYGFGVLNAYSLVTKAKDWSSVGKQLKRELPSYAYGQIPHHGKLSLKIDVPSDQITKLEHVQMVISVSHHRRGDLEIELQSPQGTTSKLLSQRPNDSSPNGLLDWPFMSVEFWGENPEGEWTLIVADVPSQEVLFDERSSQDKNPNLPSDGSLNDLKHGRFKEDYMDMAAKSDEPSSVLSDESLLCSAADQGGGCVRNWSLVIYGTES